MFVSEFVSDFSTKCISISYSGVNIGVERHGKSNNAVKIESPNKHEYGGGNSTYTYPQCDPRGKLIFTNCSVTSMNSVELST